MDDELAARRHMRDEFNNVMSEIATIARPAPFPGDSDARHLAELFQEARRHLLARDDLGGDAYATLTNIEDACIRIGWRRLPRTDAILFLLREAGPMSTDELLALLIEAGRGDETPRGVSDAVRGLLWRGRIVNTADGLCALARG